MTHAHAPELPATLPAMGSDVEKAAGIIAIQKQTAKAAATAAAPLSFTERIHRMLFPRAERERLLMEERRREALSLLMNLASLDTAAALDRIQSSRDGLSAAEVAKRLATVGPNKITTVKPVTWAEILYNSIVHPFNFLLAVLAIGNVVLNYLTNPPVDFKQFTYLMMMLVLATITRFWQETKSNNAATTLMSLVKSNATVLRRDNDSDEGVPTKIDRVNVVPGDIVQLTAGTIFPGDCLIIFAKDLNVGQSSLTGESLPVEKVAGPVPPAKTLLDHANLGLMGTNVMSGVGLAVVVTTGNRTYLSEMAAELNKRAPSTAYDRGITSVSYFLMAIMLALVIAVVLIQHFWGGQDWVTAVEFGLTVAVGIIPEMLPMILNANLSKGAMSLIKRKTIVKQLSAVQNLGAMDVLCSDKTGTLTMDEIALIKSILPLGAASSAPLKWGFLNSSFQEGNRNVIDKAVLHAAESGFGGLGSHTAISDAYACVDEIPFDFERRRLSVILQTGPPPKNNSDTTLALTSPSETILVCKGAVEEIIAHCSHYINNDGIAVPITPDALAEFTKIIDDMNSEGLRVLGIGMRTITVPQTQYSKADENDMTFVGYLAFIDPPKESSAEAIRALSHLNVAVKVLTGDNLKVSIKICNDVGIPTEHVLTGEQIAEMDDTELLVAVEKATVIAKLSPTQKQQVVVALQKNGHTVGFLGDGINDALALKTADVGVSVDSASEVAKDAADVILLEKSLMILSHGARKGRIVYGNTIKYIKMAISSNFGNVFSVVIAGLWFPSFQPITPLMLLTNNMLYDISQTAIPWDRVDESFLSKPKTWNTSDLFRFMVCIGPLSSLFDQSTFAINLYYWGWNDPNNATTLAQFQTTWFVESLLTQAIIVHLIRTEKIPFIQSTASRPVLIMTVMIIAVGIAIPYTPLGTHILQMTTFPPQQYGFIAMNISLYVVLTYFAKMIYMRVFNAWL